MFCPFTRWDCRSDCALAVSSTDEKLFACGFVSEKPFQIVNWEYSPVQADKFDIPESSFKEVEIPLES